MDQSRHSKSTKKASSSANSINFLASLYEVEIGFQQKCRASFFKASIEKV